MSAISAGFMQAAFKEKMRELEQQQAIIENRMREIDRDSIMEQIDEETLRRHISQFKEYVSTKDRDGCRRFIEAYVERIKVYEESVEVTFKVASSSTPAQGAISIKSRAKIKKLRLYRAA